MSRSLEIQCSAFFNGKVQRKGSFRHSNLLLVRPRHQEGRLRGHETTPSSADRGCIDAMYNLGVILGEGTCAPKNFKGAIEYLQHAAELNYADAQCVMGKAYAHVYFRHSCSTKTWRLHGYPALRSKVTWRHSMCWVCIVGLARASRNPWLAVTGALLSLYHPEAKEALEDELRATTAPPGPGLRALLHW